MQVVKELAIHVSIFIGLRYLNIFIAFSLGAGAAGFANSLMVRWVHLPSLLLQCLFLYFKSGQQGKGSNTVYFIIIILVTLFLMSQFHIIPSSWWLPL